MKKTIRLFGIIAAIIMLSACTSQRNLLYFQDDDVDANSPDEQTYNYTSGQSNLSPEYKLHAHDMLYIQIYSSMDEETSKLFSGNTTNSSAYAIGSETGIFLNSFEVNEQGNINLPIVGDVQVMGLSIDEAKEMIRQKAEEYVKGVVVTCRMVTFKIKVAGEVNRPGIYTFYQPSVDVFDALLSAGDLTYYGNRSKVRVIRKTATEDLVYTLDIRKASVMRDSKYYLRPGDIVYVEPNKNTKTLQYIQQPLSIIGSIASVTATVITLIIAIQNSK